MSKAYKREKAQFVQEYFTRSKGANGQTEETLMTPLCSLAVKHAVDPPNKPLSSQVLPQYGLLGFDIENFDTSGDPEPILHNTHTPHSTFICGSQGSGKSYTLSAMLENCLCGDVKFNNLLNPLAGVVFHYDKSSRTVAEAAYLCSLGIKVNVLISKSSAATDLKQRYQQLPGAKHNLRVQTFAIQDHQLNVERMQRLMAFNEQEGSVPLYMEVIHKILRDMATSGVPFSYTTFKKKLAREEFSQGQQTMMNMRLELLDSFMEKPKKNAPDMFKPNTGTLTIVDFSDPLIDQASVCVLFDICLALFIENRPADSGLVVALDEAHKFLNKSVAAANFTDRLLTTIREQRHNATRVIIATQEPTISEKLLDLCSTSIVHRFTSPAWFASIKEHLGGASSLLEGSEKQGDIFREIVDLDVGEGLVFSPSSYVRLEKGKPKKLGSHILKMKTRTRDGVDGGRSVSTSGEQMTSGSGSSSDTDTSDGVGGATKKFGSLGLNAGAR